LVNTKIYFELWGPNAEIEESASDARAQGARGIDIRPALSLEWPTALAYIRVSVVGDRAKRGRFESPDLQRAAIDAWCQARGIEVVDEIRDLNRSGGHLTRPGLEQAMGLVPTLADGIVVARGDRASRRALDGLGLLDQLEKAGGWIAAADCTIDTSTRTAKMATTMHFAMAENELERYRETSAVVHERAIVDKGRHMGATPFGYRRDADKRLVIDTLEAKWVTWIFEQRADGRGWASMSRELTERGVRQDTGRKLTHQMMRRMVTHRVYLGVAYHGKHVHPDAHPALIDSVLFEAANRVLPGAPPPRAGRVNVIGGLPRCAGCSYVLKPLITRPGDYRWLCRTLLAEQSATYECPAPARIRGSEHDTLKRLVWMPRRSSPPASAWRPPTISVSRPHNARAWKLSTSSMTSRR
jgi:DNA invertase Pin-like site-specific DNA recombinase